MPALKSTSFGFSTPALPEDPHSTLANDDDDNGGTQLTLACQLLASVPLYIYIYISSNSLSFLFLHPSFSQ